MILAAVGRDVAELLAAEVTVGYCAGLLLYTGGNKLDVLAQGMRLSVCAALNGLVLIIVLTAGPTLLPRRKVYGSDGSVGS